GQCQMLLVLADGYATAGLTPCEGGQMQVLASGWVEPAQWEQFDTWLYNRGPVYQDNSYLDGRGTTEMSSTETAALTEWAKAVYAELSEISSSPTEVPPALNLRQVLAQQLQTDVASVQIVSVEEKTWPDNCLGAPYADQLCLPQETPGYLISLAVNNDQYTYHTDREGLENRLVSAPEPSFGEPILTWSGSDDSGCRTVEVGLDGVAYGHCGGLLMGVPFSFDTRPADIAEFAETYASFEAETPVGTVKLTGTGPTVATPVEQRMLAEWANLVYLEAESGRSGASWGLVFAWHREGGLAGFCDDVSVYVTGQVYAASCKGEQPQDLGRTRLNADQLATIFNWVDTLQPFEQTFEDPAVADGMTTSLVFSGAGSQPAHEPDIALIFDFAQNLFNEVSMQAAAPPAVCLTPEQDQQLLLVEAHGYCLLYPAAYSLVQTNPNGTEIVKDTVMNHIDPRVSIEVQPAEGRSLEEVADQLEADYGAGFDIVRTTITVDGVDAVMLDNLPGQDLNRRVVFIQNDRRYSLFVGPIGEEGSDIRQQAEVLYQQVIDSFRFLESTGSTPTDESSESGLLPSDVQYVMAMADLNIRSGPGTGYPIIGSVFGGQIALVTGATPDGQWWRVICPDDTVGDCFVIADPALTQPTTAPGTP
ncbi:MAG: SH3 domain-containing protein, partial [Anaerolineae bacterium]|nr:SH3 domain-containing protein [Anaerolineae bacterium]